MLRQLQGAKLGVGQQAGRGCVFFNFGATYALRLLVSIHSLRRFYDGPVTVFLVKDATSDALKAAIESLGVDVRLFEHLSKSFDRHRLFYESPYVTTLTLDSDMIFCAPIDDLWEPLEQNGVLVTRFHAPAYGIDGTPERPGNHNRVALLASLKGILDGDVYDKAVHRLVHDGIDVNIGVLGISRTRGDAFLDDWAHHMERGRSAAPQLLDEMLVVALLGQHQHYLADEKWNCPADEFFRRTNLADAKVIHYFGDGSRQYGIRQGRNRATWAGMKWFEYYHAAARQLDLKPWQDVDTALPGRFEVFLTNLIDYADRRRAKRSKRRAKAARRK